MLRARSAALVLALVLAPVASATWSAFGSAEPDSLHDDPTYMWHAAPGAEDRRVYFAAHTRQGPTEINPNVGFVGTRIETVGTERPEAILGVWIDCNNDGYVGMLETGLREYASTLLSSQDRCPAVSGAPNSWPAGAHNYNGWVSELIPIGPRGYTGNTDMRYYQDEEAMVWGDHGLPDGSGQRPVCTLAELPAGGARTTGRILDHVDCYLAVMADERSSALHDHALTLIGDPTFWTTGGAWSGSASPLDQGTLGDAESTNSHITLTDCSEYPIQLTGDEPPGGELDGWRIEEPNDIEYHEEGTIAGTLVYATEYAHQGGSWYNSPDSNGPCSDGVDDNTQFYGLVEGNAVDVHERRKDSADWQFRFYRAPRGGGLAGAHEVSPIDGYAGAPSDLGVEYIPSHCSAELQPTFCAQTRWYAPTVVRAPPSIVKSDLANGALQLADAYVLSFYAKVGEMTMSRGFSLPGPTYASGTYGSATCGEYDAGVRRGWECDAALWYPGVHCARGPWGACADRPVPGTTYHLRDIDCYDGGVGSAGIGVLPAFYGADPCPL